MMLLLVLMLSSTSWAFSTTTRRSAFGIAAGMATVKSVSSARGVEKAAAVTQLDKSAEALRQILSSYDDIVAGGGDSLRRELGFVGTSSPLFSVDKALTAVSEDADDPVEFGERFDDFLLALRAADADAYSANFVTFSSAKGTPAGYFKSARKEVDRALHDLDAILALLPR